MKKKIKICSILMVSLYLVGILREMEDSNLKTVEFIFHDVCGKKGNVDLVVVTPEEATEAATVIEYLNNTNPDYDFMNSMNSAQYNTMYRSIAQTALPWLILLVFSLLGCVSYFYCTVFDICCPPCKCCRRDLVVEPYGKGELLFPLILIHLSSLIIIATGLAGIIFSTSIANTMDVARCSVFAGIADLMLPGANNWPGIIALGGRFEVLGKQLPVFLNETVTLFMNATPDEYYNDFNNLIDQNSKLVQNLYYQSNTEINPVVPTYYDSYFEPMLSFIAQGDIPQVQSLLPYAQITFPQKQGFDLLYTLIIQSTVELNAAGQSIANNQASFDASITKAVEDISNISSLLQNQTNSLYDFTADTNKYGNMITLASRIIFGISIGLAVFAIIGALLLCCKRFYGRFFLHIVWFFYTLIIIPGLLMVAVLYPATGIMAEICEFTEDVLSVRQSFIDQRFIKDALLRRVIIECLYDGGDIITVLKVNDQLGVVSQLSNKISSFSDTGAQFITLIGQFNILDKNQQFLNQLDQILIVDYEPYDQNNRSNIATLMKDFYLPTYSTDCYQDAFSLTISSCPNSYPFINSTEAYVSTQTSYCFGSYFLIESKAEIVLRYSQCPEQSTDYTNLVAFFIQQSNNWGPIVDQESKIVIQNQANTNKITSQISDINKYINKTNIFIKTVADPKEGILSGVQCGFLKTTVQRFQDTLCVSTITTLWKVQLLLAIMTTTMMVGACCSYCAGNRFYGLSHQKYLRVKEQENKYKDIPQQQYQYPQQVRQQPRYDYPQQQVNQNQLIEMQPR